MPLPAPFVALLVLITACAEAPVPTEEEPKRVDLDGDGFTVEEGDCDDEDAYTYPGAAQYNSASWCMTDVDGDGWGAPKLGQVEHGWRAGTDCDDTDASLNPQDRDADGYTSCEGDCDDTNMFKNPDDDDGDGYTGCDDCDDEDEDLNLDDIDGDGYSTCDGDCDDHNAALNFDDIDGDGYTTCDTECDDLDAAMNSDDLDGDGYSTCEEDCDDSDPAVHPNPGEGEGVLFDRDCDGFGPEINLSNADYIFFGEASSSALGYDMGTAGDVDGDGLADFLLGAPGKSDSGSAYLFLGKSLSAEGIFSASTADYKFTLDSEAGSVGARVVSAGDVDGDGLSDLLFGAPTDGQGGIDAGAVFLVLAASMGSDRYFDLEDADYKFLGEREEDWLGNSPISAGDVDGDGLSDLLFGASSYIENGSSVGAAYLFLAANLGRGRTLEVASADYKFTADDNNDFLGSSLSLEGDVDGDGLADVLLGATGDDDGGQNTGAVYLFWGSSLGAESSLPAASADCKLVGFREQGGAGTGLALGDVDGDGRSDILIGASSVDDGATDAGAAYLVLASTLGDADNFDLSDADTRFIGGGESHRIGTSLSIGGDVDGDGLNDFLFGTYFYLNERPGYAFLVFASTLGSAPSFKLSDADYIFVGEEDLDYAGKRLSFAGDVDADGRSDVFIGASGNDANGSKAGAVYVLLTQ